MDFIPSIVDAVKEKIPVFYDGNITKGSDIFKTLALGAKAVIINRPAQWGYAHKVKFAI